MPTCKEDLPEGWTDAEDFTLDDFEAALANESMPVWVGVNEMLDEACKRKGWNSSEALVTQVCVCVCVFVCTHTHTNPQE